jgi:hypothetical protein
MPNPEATPAVAAGGRLSPEWVRYISALLAYIDALEARIKALET